ncbi:acetoacetate--CoA ligase [Streptomyces mirabilis]|uniref:acetoacetate--CoA ligase n=1 Tax=Streptomyces mirabilis TaxID=68239 RepID=UPI0036B41067
MTPTSARVVWRPAEDAVAETNIERFAEWLRRIRDIDVAGYQAMWEWSVRDLEGFWGAVWEYLDFGTDADYDQVLTGEAMPGARWFTGARVNFAEYVLRPRSQEDTVAVVTVGETGDRSDLTWRELRRKVAALAKTMRDKGITSGDVVVSYMPNIAETIIACLATASLGAIWSGVGQDYVPRAAVDRFAQLQPKMLFAADGHHYNGKARDQRAAVAELRAQLPTLTHVIGVARLGHGIDDALEFEAATAGEATFEPVDTAFDHPLWVLFSSGTTGLPKGIVHGHGGMLIENVKLLTLNWDLRPTDRLTWYTSPSWVMWNFLVSALSRGGSVLCYDGAPHAEGPASLWRIVSDNAVTVFGTSPGFLAMSEDRGVRPSDEYDVSALRIMGSTGAPLPEKAFDYVAREVGDIPLFSMTGGTDIAGAFALGAPNVPVWAGELPVIGLGAAVESWSDDGEPRINQVGELVATRPMPNMPLCFWNDPDGSRYRAAYFETFPGVWRHGDWITITDRGSVVVHGRSDSTLNRNGVRMGSADIYAAVESMDEIAEALVIGAEEEDGGYWMPLFVTLNDGCVLDDGLVARVKTRIRDLVSPRHVPDQVLAVAGIPHTRTGKKLEVPIKRLIQGAPLEQVVDPSIVDEPRHIAAFQTIARERRARVRDRH